MICNDANYKNMREITVPNRVEFKSDGANPLYYANKFKVVSYAADPNKDNSISSLLEYPEWKINNDKLFNLQSLTIYKTDYKEYLLKVKSAGKL
jgi:hemin uptake protein HemP